MMRTDARSAGRHRHFLVHRHRGLEPRTPLGQWEIGKEEYANGVLVAHGAEFDLAYAEGRALAFDAAVDEALAEAAGAPEVESNRQFAQ
jgi:hypothetical protein